MVTNNYRQGFLIYDQAQDQIDIRLDTGGYYGGLHCGETMDVLIDKQWIPTRIEKGEYWYLVGVKTKVLQGLTVRK